MSDEFILGAYWKHRQQRLSEHIADLKRFLSELQKVDAAFSGLLYRSKSLTGYQAPILPDLSNFQQLILQKGDFDSRDYDHADSTGRPTLDSNPYINFQTSFWDGKAAIKGGLQIGVSAGVAHERLTSAVIVEFPFEEFGDYWLHLERLNPLFETIIRVWCPAWALVTSHVFRDQVKTDWKKKATIGWLNYFADPAVAAALPSEVKCKTLENGGVILQLTDERLSAQNIDHIALAKKVQNSLDARGLLELEHIFNYAGLESADARF